MNYTKELTEKIVAEYVANPELDTVKKLAEKYEKPVKSIIGKLSREGVYQKASYTTKTGDPVVTKKELVEEICSLIGVEELPGLEITPKLTLKKLVKQLNDLLGDED